jgi:hypothetical protein
VGIWGPGPFQNDIACDLLLDILDSGDLSLLEETLDGVLSSRECGDPFDAASGVAAVELVARLRGRPGLRESTPEELFVESEVGPDLSAVHTWVERWRSALTETLVGKARRALARVLSETAEHQKYWRDVQSFATWQHELEHLMARLQ